MPPKKFVPFPVVSDKTIVAVYKAFESGAIQKTTGIDWKSILKALKTILVAIGQWDAFIAAIRKLKDAIPGSIDDAIIEALIAWLQAL